MGRSVPHGHLGLDPSEEFVEIDIEVLKEDGQGRQRRQRTAVLHGAHQRSGERRPNRCLAETRLQPSSAELLSDHRREASLAGK